MSLFQTFVALFFILLWNISEDILRNVSVCVPPSHTWLFHKNHVTRKVSHPLQIKIDEKLDTLLEILQKKQTIIITLFFQHTEVNEMFIIIINIIA